MFKKSSINRIHKSSQSPSKDRVKIDPFLLIRKGDMREIQQRIESGEISLQVTRWSGFTLLHRAAEIGHSDLCRYLVEAGIVVDVRSAHGWYTPLHIALGNGFLETAQLLVDMGADPWKKSKYGEDPFTFGAKRGFTKMCDEFKAKFIGQQLRANVQRMISQPGTSMQTVVASSASSLHTQD